MAKSIIIIPALNPDLRLCYLVNELKNLGLNDIVIIDDGSTKRVHDGKNIFHEITKMGCILHRHNANLGKGAAIKSGIKTAIKTYGNNIEIITCDADGQHLPKDIRRVADALKENPTSLILGTRDFSGENVPKKSKYGNKITSLFFRITKKKKCPDTQTGLRGIPNCLIPLALEEQGQRYEYEMNFLSDAADINDMIYVPIETVYEDGNKTSHFRPVQDSLLVYGRPLRYASSSLISTVAEYALFILLEMFLGSGAFFAQAGSRIFSGIINFALNKYWAFGSKRSGSRELIRYSILFGAQLLISATLITALSYVMSAVIAKIIVDTCLFFISYQIQRRWVFKKGATTNERKIYKKTKNAKGKIYMGHSI
ncbi:MAG: bifunctional glycosyltransferase family 2/GtrA family protein [Lachnospiraceae bacterium]|nr:bifunctional glycosyltransferase family 2/GtrA family protein [Lachnospiraceae bacterium]